MASLQSSIASSYLSNLLNAAALKNTGNDIHIRTNHTGMYI